MRLCSGDEITCFTGVEKVFTSFQLDPLNGNSIEVKIKSHLTSPRHDLNLHGNSLKELEGLKTLSSSLFISITNKKS